MSDLQNAHAIRAMCTDIDGTLLDSRRELSDQTISVIKRLSRLMPVILASSRMPSAMRHLQQQLDILQHPLICYNGGLILQYAHDQPATVLHSAQIPLKVCSEIVAMGKGKSMHISLYVNDEWYAPGVDQWTEREATITKVSPMLKRGEDVIKMWGEKQSGAHKIMIMGEPSEIKIMEAALRSNFAHEIHVYHSKSTYLEIAPKIISKASALRLLLEKTYQIPLSSVIAFGDNYNDIELLQHVGMGIAVANAREEVKAVAREVTLESKNDGVAHAILKHILDKA